MHHPKLTCPRTGKLLDAGTTRAQENAIAKRDMMGWSIDRALPGRPSRRCGACGAKFQQTVQRRRLCGDCYRRASGDPDTYSIPESA